MLEKKILAYVFINFTFLCLHRKLATKTKIINIFWITKIQSILCDCASMSQYSHVSNIFDNYNNISNI